MTHAETERRQHARIAFRTPGRLALGNRALPVEVLDISLKGALIRLAGVDSPTALAIGSKCALDILLDDADDDHIHMEAHVAHSHGDRAGLLCTAIDLDSITHLRRLVELNLGSPAMLERELNALVSDA